jgi:hypothetical protein
MEKIFLPQIEIGNNGNQFNVLPDARREKMCIYLENLRLNREEEEKLEKRIC